jgi:hypothetical protein
MTEDAPVEAIPPIDPIVTRRNERPYFNDTQLVPPANEYVCWIDIMGSQSIMLRSLKIASHFLMKLHIAGLRAFETYRVDPYPVIDGIYACSPSQGDILRFINRVNSALAITFILEDNPLHKFEIRTGIAYGPIVKGIDARGCADELYNYPTYAEQI